MERKMLVFRLENLGATGFFEKRDRRNVLRNIYLCRFFGRGVCTWIDQ